MRISHVYPRYFSLRCGLKWIYLENEWLFSRCRRKIPAFMPTVPHFTLSDTWRFRSSICSPYRQKSGSGKCKLVLIQYQGNSLITICRSQMSRKLNWKKLSEIASQFNFDKIDLNFMWSFPNTQWSKCDITYDWVRRHRRRKLTNKVQGIVEDDLMLHGILDLVFNLLFCVCLLNFVVHVLDPDLVSLAP